MTIEQYKKILDDAFRLMDAYDDLEPTSAFKQCAYEHGIPFGEEMGKFVTWAREQI